VPGTEQGAGSALEGLGHGFGVQISEAQVEAVTGIVGGTDDDGVELGNGFADRVSRGGISQFVGLAFQPAFGVVGAQGEGDGSIGLVVFSEVF
jgi:hypothetical protein